MFSVARVELRHPKQDLGKWDFVELPKEGDYLAIRLNDKPMVLLVERKVHSPVMFPALTGDKLNVPQVLIMVSIVQTPNEAQIHD